MPWRVADAPAVPGVKIEKHPFADHYKAWTEEPWPHYVGELHVNTHPQTGERYVGMISVDEDYRRQGIGKAMWEKAGRPKHNPGRSQTPLGAAWAKAVGGENRTIASLAPWRVAMPMLTPEGVTYHYRPNAPSVEARLDGKTVGTLEWHPPGTRHHDHGEVSHIEVHPDYRRHGIGTGMYDFAKQHEPAIHHSENLTDTGDSWVEYEQTRTAAAKHTGGMIALYPRADSAQAMAVPTGEPVEELHCTLVFLGDNIVSQNAPDPLLQSMGNLAHSFAVIVAQVTGRAMFDEGAVVYLIGDNPQLPDLHEYALNAAYTITTVPRQHVPYVPHVTVGYDINPMQLDFKGTVIFDRLGVALGNKTHFFPLLGATV